MPGQAEARWRKNSAAIQPFDFVYRAGDPSIRAAEISMTGARRSVKPHCEKMT
jgi:hypothetical protein